MTNQNVSGAVQSQPGTRNQSWPWFYVITHGQLSRANTVALEDQRMWDRINCLIDSVADQPYALQIRYHLKCWLKYLRKYQKISEDYKLPHMHNVTLREVQTIFFNHIRTVIFEEHELRSLQSHLRDYRSIISQYGFPTSVAKSSYVKDILTREFESKIGFHSRSQRNQCEIVYMTCQGVVHMLKQHSPPDWCQEWATGVQCGWAAQRWYHPVAVKGRRARGGASCKGEKDKPPWYQHPHQRRQDAGSYTL